MLKAQVVTEVVNAVKPSQGSLISVDLRDGLRLTSADGDGLALLAAQALGAECVNALAGVAPDAPLTGENFDAAVTALRRHYDLTLAAMVFPAVRKSVEAEKAKVLGLLERLKSEAVGA